jgi:hypothetical protein
MVYEKVLPLVSSGFEGSFEAGRLRDGASKSRRF